MQPSLPAYCETGRPVLRRTCGLENVLRPYLISRGSSLPILLILLGMLGGLAAFGLLGIFVGPTILAVSYALITEWADAPPVSPT